MYVPPRLVQTVMSAQKLLCLSALGNPEPLYRSTRHNAGVIMLRMLKNEFCPDAVLKTSNVSPHIQYCHEPRLNLLMLFNKSQFMNLSGHAMIPVWRKLPHDALHVVLHDELNIPIGNVQLRKPGTSFRGHNGLRDMIKMKGDDKFHKLGIGIDRPNSRDPRIVADYVLANFTKGEMETLQYDSFQKAVEHVRKLLPH